MVIQFKVLVVGVCNMVRDFVFMPLYYLIFIKVDYLGPRYLVTICLGIILCYLKCIGRVKKIMWVSLLVSYNYHIFPKTEPYFVAPLCELEVIRA